MYTLSDRRGHLLSQILTAHIGDKIDEALMVGLAFREAYGAFGELSVSALFLRVRTMTTIRLSGSERTPA